MDTINDNQNINDPKTNMGDVYDEFAQKFSEADKLPTWKYVGKPALVKLLKDFFNRKDITFLDMGSASGRVEEHLLLKNGVPAKNITGVEISPDQVEIAKARLPEVNFMVGDITQVVLPDESFDVALSHMVFEHLDDEGLLSASKIAFNALKSGGVFAFVVTHPDKMTNLDGSLVEGYGSFITSAPWGGELLNWRRKVEDTSTILKKAGFVIDSVEELKFPEPTSDIDPEVMEEFMKSYKKYSAYPAIRLAVRATKPKA